MSIYVSLLRGINVSGQKQIKMAELKGLYESLGLAQVETYVQSGNVIFESAEPDPAQLASLIEGGIQQALGYEVTVFIRTPADLKRLVESNPFLKDQHADTTPLHVTFLHTPPADPTLDRPDSGRDEFRIAGREVYVFCPDGYGKTKLSNAFFERKLKTSATTRNWKTVTTLNDLASQAEG